MPMLQAKEVEKEQTLRSLRSQILKAHGLHPTSEHRREDGNPELACVSGGGGRGLMALVGRVSGKGKAEPPLAGPSEDALRVPSLR